MNIGLINTYSYDNTGDAAIYTALSKLLTNHSVYSTLKDNADKPISRIQYREDLSNCDSYISVGGDIFNNTRPWLFTRNFLYNLKQLKNATNKTFLFGQSIPASCSGIALHYLSYHLKQLAKVVVRDQQSYNILTNLGVNCSLSYDVAFILKPSQKAIKTAAEILTAHNAPRSAVISVREFNALYPTDNSLFIRNIALLCKQLKYLNYQPVLLIQSSVSEHDNDRHIANAIKQLCPEAKILNIFEYSALLPNWELLQALLIVSRLIIAVRYHTAVLALAAGRTPFNLFYSNKGADLSSRLGVMGCHVDQFNTNKFLPQIEQSANLVFDPKEIIKSIYFNFKEGMDSCHATQNGDYYEHI